MNWQIIQVGSGHSICLWQLPRTSSLCFQALEPCSVPFLTAPNLPALLVSSLVGMLKGLGSIPSLPLPGFGHFRETILTILIPALRIQLLALDLLAGFLAWSNLVFYQRKSNIIEAYLSLWQHGKFCGNISVTMLGKCGTQKKVVLHREEIR
jgi:hypothetical protein